MGAAIRSGAGVALPRELGGTLSGFSSEKIWPPPGGEEEIWGTLKALAMDEAVKSITRDTVMLQTAAPRTSARQVQPSVTQLFLSVITSC